MRRLFTIVTVARVRLLIGAALVSLAAVLAAQSREQPIRQPTDPGVVTTRQAITPAGIQSVFDGRVYGLAFGQVSGRVWVLTPWQVFELDWGTNQVIQRVDADLSPGLQGLQFDRTASRAVVVGASRKRQAGKPPDVRLATLTSDTSDSAAPAATREARAPELRFVDASLGRHLAGAVAVARQPRKDGRRIAAVPLTYDNFLAIVDLESFTVIGSVKTAIAPFGVALDETGTIAWVTNWGGRLPTPGELTAPMGSQAAADQVVVDKRGVAASGTISRVNLEALTVTDTLEVGLHPTAIAWDEPRARLYVANSNDDSVSIVDTNRRRVIDRIAIRPFGPDVAGATPTAVAVAPDGARLYVACGGINAVAVVATATRAIEGYIPTAWYPTTVAVSPDGQRLAIGALLGVGSGWRRTGGPSPGLGTPDPARRYVHANRGAISVLPVPDERDLVNYTAAVAENNRMPFPPGGLGPADPAAARDPSKLKPAAVPLTPSDPSLIEHVVYIVKENRTYDQVFGDLPAGNGDSSLVLFGEDVTPNHRRLATEFVLLDNFYATGGNSGDGHQWVTQANETAYAMWPGYTGRSYPYDGSDPLAYSKGGFIWDAARQRGRSVRIYGEYMPSHTATPSKQRPALLAEWRTGADFSNRWTATPRVQGMIGLVAPDYPTYSNAIPDVIRADLFLRDVRRWEQEGRMPNLVLLQLPCDHTYGTSAGLSTPRAMVADNDLALGRIGEALSRSRFWPKMAIFVVEDDAQDGVDHVDGHRTVALAISPYVRRRHVDSTFYSQPSMLKTIELMLGLSPLSIFDRIANDMRASFSDAADLTPYTARVPQQSLEELNPPLAKLSGQARDAAAASARMRFDVPDAAPTDRLNRILWHSIKGWRTPYPGVRTAVFAPLSLDVDDAERK